MKHENVKKMVALALLAALVVVLQTVASGIKVGPIPITLTLVPIVIGAVLYGPGAGAGLGAIFGLVTAIAGLTGADGGTQALIQANAFWTLATCIVKATAAGWVAGLVYQALRKQSGVPETAEPMALVYDNTREYYSTGDSSKLVSYATLRHDPLPDSITQLCADPRTGYTYTDAYYDGAGQLELSYLEDAVNNGTREQEDADDGWLELPADGNSEMRALQLGAALNEQPYYVSDGLFLIYPYSAWDRIAGVAQEKGEIRFLFRASNHKQAYNTLQAYLTEQQISGYVHDNAADAEGRRAVITVVNVFS